jgi:alkaline phosphatase
MEETPPAVILMIGDGMGLSQLSAALYSSSSPLSIENFPIIGFHKSYSADNLITDSAAGATAFACGQKTYNGAIGINADTVACQTILEEAESYGLATGLIATSSIVHATPASFAAHQKMRIFYEEIAVDLCNSGVDLFIGGGKRYFDRRYSDERNLIDELRDKNYIVNDFLRDKLQNTKLNPAMNFVFFTADNQPLPVNQGRSYLSYASRIGPQFLHFRGADKGFFLMIEGSQIDWANHSNEGKWAISETLDFDRAVGEVLNFAKQRGNTLVIVTADHESGGMAIQKGSKLGRVKTEFTTNGHTAALVPVYAFGPGAEMFGGIYENTAIYYKMRQFYGWDEPDNNSTNLQKSATYRLQN